jgi:glucans biosynthesis protein C
MPQPDFAARSLPHYTGGDASLSAGFDVVRLLCMVLGVAYHLAQSFVPGTGPWYLVEDTQANGLFTSLVSLVHLFRMPVFMCLAGLLAQRSLSQKAWGAFVVARAQRLLVPFAVALPLQWLAEWLVCHWAMRLGLLRADSTWSQPFHFAPRHLWFLEYLFMMSAVLAGLKHLSPAPRLAVAVVSAAVGQLGWGPDNPGESLWLLPHSGFTLFAFFVLGSALAHLQRAWMQWALLPGMLGAIGVTVFGDRAPFLLRAVELVSPWLVAVGAIAWAAHWKANQKAMLSRLADGSYWMYLTHYPLVLVMQVGLAASGVPGVVKWSLMLVLLLAAGMLSFVTAVEARPWASQLGVTRSPYKHS